MPTWSRKRFEAIVLSLIAFASLVPLRMPVEHRPTFVSELVCVLVLTIAAAWKPSRVQRVATLLLPVTPIAFAALARYFTTPIAYEVTMLSVFGAAAIAMAVGGRGERWHALSLVSSGFLVLFAASISDHAYAVVYPLAWILVCVWHLVANHWERLDLAMPDQVTRTWTLRPGSVLVAAAVLAVGGLAVKDRFTESKHLTFGFMPTSGGSDWSDPAAKRGVGSGDAAIAAKDFAESFGAVDSELFLESQESTLFDMFNDLIGEPKKKKNKMERRQAMANQKIIPSHERAAKSEQGGGSFSTDRVPPEKHQHFDDANDPGIVQWDGPVGIRLAMHRYDAFDGIDWTQENDLSEDELLRVDFGEDAWFFDPGRNDLIHQDPDKVQVGLLKAIKLGSNRLPVPMLTGGIHIKEVNRQDFFGIQSDGSFYMPGRDKVPPLTVVHIASEKLTEDEIREQLVASETVVPCGIDEIADLAKRIVDDRDHPYDQLRALIGYLRDNGTLDPQAVSDSVLPVSEFAGSTQGGSHLFATTAALLAREIGLQSRLVTGFYVRPSGFDMIAGHTSVRPDDVHVWAEIRLSDGRWFEVEPTPGYREPLYHPSLWLRCRQSVARQWPAITVGTAAAFLAYVTRRIWIDWTLYLVWWLAPMLRPRRRLGLAMWTIENRAKLVGQRRPRGQSQRDWMEQLTRDDHGLQTACQQFCDAADRLFYGGNDDRVEKSSTRIVRLLNTQTISKITKEAAV
ncbi:transglutaminase-like domain-containing protein [Crateriforma conspicua]|uniref:Transglutaminase-like superfamily protein n=1 Tax=Crateriforma conspicua TaxID=2527996 RepID=A0A5C5Y8I3_9PLAN|nr:transglutaminase-like domain-containing protein [Crateriforma conspicua]TWT70575.1 Transglutaminase-like superfamily protein [Crateriforma conspicua]